MQNQEAYIVEISLPISHSVCTLLLTSYVQMDKYYRWFMQKSRKQNILIPEISIYLSFPHLCHLQKILDGHAFELIEQCLSITWKECSFHLFKGCNFNLKKRWSDFASPSSCKYLGTFPLDPPSPIVGPSKRFVF